MLIIKISFQFIELTNQSSLKLQFLRLRKVSRHVVKKKDFNYVIVNQLEFIGNLFFRTAIFNPGDVYPKGYPKILRGTQNIKFSDYVGLGVREYQKVGNRCFVTLKRFIVLNKNLLLISLPRFSAMNSLFSCHDGGQRPEVCP